MPPSGGGFKLSLANAKGKPGLRATSDNPAKRRRLALDEEEPEEDNAKQEITGWDAEGGAIDANPRKEEKKGPRIIPALPDGFWSQMGDQVQKNQRTQIGAPPEQNGDAMEIEEPQKLAHGLTIFKKTDQKANGKEPEPLDQGPTSSINDLTTEEGLEAEAMDRIINSKSGNRSVIRTEDEALQDFMASAPDVPSLEAYEATPIEGFGAALLRGMGWKEDQVTVKPKKVEKRPPLLGIGAKPEAALGTELGGWGKGSSKKQGFIYTPVVLRNKHTKELLTEEELKGRLESQALAGDKSPRGSRYTDEENDRKKYDSRDRRNRDRREYDYDSKWRSDDQHRDRDRRDRNRSRSPHHDDRRDRDRDRDRRDRDRNRRDRGADDDDRREKRRDRDRRDRSVDSHGYHKERRRDRERRDRDQSRSKDSGDRRERRRERDYIDKRGGRKRSEQ